MITYGKLHRHSMHNETLRFGGFQSLVTLFIQDNLLIFYYDLDDEAF